MLICGPHLTTAFLLYIFLPSYLQRKPSPQAYPPCRLLICCHSLYLLHSSHFILKRKDAVLVAFSSDNRNLQSLPPPLSHSDGDDALWRVRVLLPAPVLAAALSLWRFWCVRVCDVSRAHVCESYREKIESERRVVKAVRK